MHPLRIDGPAFAPKHMNTAIAMAIAHGRRRDRLDPFPEWCLVAADQPIAVRLANEPGRTVQLRRSLTRYRCCTQWAISRSLPDATLFLPKLPGARLCPATDRQQGASTSGLPRAGASCAALTAPNRRIAAARGISSPRINRSSGTPWAKDVPTSAWRSKRDLLARDVRLLHAKSPAHVTFDFA